DLDLGSRNVLLLVNPREVSVSGGVGHAIVRVHRSRGKRLDPSDVDSEFAAQSARVFERQDGEQAHRRRRTPSRAASRAGLVRSHKWAILTVNAARMPEIYGNVTGLAPQAQKTLERIYRRRVSLDRIATPE